MFLLQIVCRNVHVFCKGLRIEARYDSNFIMFTETCIVSGNGLRVET